LPFCLFPDFACQVIQNGDSVDFTSKAECAAQEIKIGATAHRNLIHEWNTREPKAGETPT